MFKMGRSTLTYLSWWKIDRPGGWRLRPLLCCYFNKTLAIEKAANFQGFRGQRGVMLRRSVVQVLFFCKQQETKMLDVNDKNVSLSVFCLSYYFSINNFLIFWQIIFNWQSSTQMQPPTPPPHVSCIFTWTSCHVHFHVSKNQNDNPHFMDTVDVKFLPRHRRSL